MLDGGNEGTYGRWPMQESSQWMQWMMVRVVRVNVGKRTAAKLWLVKE